MLKIFIVLAAVSTLIFGIHSSNNEPSQKLTIYLGISLSSFFFLMGIKDWSKDIKIGSYILFLGSIVILIVMVNSAMNY
ncbi:hypothetical protein [Metaplanococcus flavidus]|uniref:DUF3953 domain-containing protein n=1 Tax=Metaplanococcus flavidus TaxID=569883 RepID=A0ABW3LCJ8_9BACL